MNAANMSSKMAFIDITNADMVAIVKFLHGLTDERVRQEQAPFDHPQIFIPNGNSGNPTRLVCDRQFPGCESVEEIPAVGASGRQAAGLAPLQPFLDTTLQSDAKRRRCS
jgi:hypothetical protein